MPISCIILQDGASTSHSKRRSIVSHRKRARLSTEGRLYLCLFAEQGWDLRSLLRGGATDADVASAVAAIWQGRTDRYSQLRGQLAADTGSGRRRVEMSYIGG